MLVVPFCEAQSAISGYLLHYLTTSPDEFKSMKTFSR